ncbi:MAG TPA: multidrug effflux MFS transporter [Acetobacteraceae bacterium]|nr:multidrug effflux MFS transporter [Acetobacteraceae bacterium]
MPGWLPLLLGFLTAVGPISTDMYLPAFPAIEASLGGAPGTAQITLATWFAGLAVGQITQGTLSDRFGRRGPLLVGTAIYTIASVGCALAPGLAALSVWRAVAAFGGSASMVIPRAIVRDLADGHGAAQLMSRLMLVMGAAPILAPTLGGAVLGFASWHAIFWIAAAYGVVCLVVVWAWLPDTLPPDQRVRLRLGALVSRYAAIGRERSFLTHVLVGSFAMFGMFAYLGGSPGVFINIYHLEPAIYGMLFGSCAAGLIAASQANPRLIRRFGPERVLSTAAYLFLLAGAALAAVTFAGRAGLIPVPLAAVYLPIWIAIASCGFIMPNATVGALSRHAAHAGSASALMGTLQFVLGAISGSLVGVLDDGTARPMALLMLAGGLGAAAADRARLRTEKKG